MKQILLISLLFSTTCSFSQNFGNEWIDYSQKYYAFKVVQSGLYKIDSTALANAGIPIGTIAASSIQIFGRDKEVPLYMVDGGDNVLNATDYFVFEASKNDGWLDSTIVPDPNRMANPSVSLINDTIEYFFTWKNSGNGLRFTDQADQNFNSYSPKNYVFVTVVSPFLTSYYEGIVAERASGSVYSEGEGYGFAALDNSGSGEFNYSIPTPNPYTGTDAPNPVFHARSTANSLSTATAGFNHHLQLGIGAPNLIIFDSIFYGYLQVRKTQVLPYSVINSTNTNFKYKIVNDLGALVDRQALTYYKLNYNRLPNANNQNFDQFSINNHALQSKSRIDLSALSVTDPIVFSYGSAILSQKPIFNGTEWQFIIPNSSTNETQIHVYDLVNFNTVSNFKAVNGNGVFTDFSLLNPDSALLMIYHPSLETASNNYINYRRSLAGGSYNAIKANIIELTQQFGGGVPRHIAGVRRFTHFIYAQATQKPAGLFLMGKGISSKIVRFDPAASANVLIPSLGYPSSDNAITSGLVGTRFEPLIPVGRISVPTNELLQSYLDKIIQYEAAQVVSAADFSSTKNWQKQILHFVGGSDAGQQTVFQNYMSNMKNIIEDSSFAGNVTSFYKTSSDPLDPIVVAGVTDKISEGVSIMNFFGHSAATNNGFEINIDDPSNWDNQGKYPLVIANSCYTGDIFKSEGVASEFYVNVPQEGAIAYYAHNSSGYAGQLSIFTAELFKQFSYKNYGSTLGFQIKKTIEELQVTYGGVFFESTYSQMTLNGDPMLRVNFSKGPELELKLENITYSPANINLSVDSIEVSVLIKNLGKSIEDSIFIEVIRNFPGSEVDSLYKYFIPGIDYDYDFKVKFPLQPSISAGLNQFSFKIDIPNQYTEEFDDISNNSVTSNLFINIDGISPIWPYNYAVVPSDLVTVKASTNNPIAALQTYRFELDTTDTYDSPQLRKFSITELGGVKEVNPNQWLSSNGTPFPLICSDSSVYFWRVAVDSAVLNWSEFSFQYILGKRGWGQDHFFQFKNNDFSSLDYNRNDRSRSFPPTELHSVTIDVFDSYNGFTSLFNGWYIDQELEDYATCSTDPKIYVGVIDPLTLEAWKTHCPGCATPNNDPTMDFGNLNNLGSSGGGGCRNRFEKYFTFSQTDATSMSNFQNMIETGVPDGHYIIVYTPFTTTYSTWNTIAPTIYNTFQNIGAPQINNTLPEKPFALFFKKGITTQTQVKLWPQDTVTIADAPPGGPRLQLIANVFKPDYVGVETTPLIGPSFEWQTLYWRRDSLESPSTDSVRIYIDCYDINASFITRIDTVFTPNDSILNLNSIVSATQYPYIRLSIYNSDIQSVSPAQIDRLHVLYSPVPEAAIDGTLAYFFKPSDADSLKEGQIAEFAVDVKNISDYPMDSLLINYWIEDAQHVRHDLPYGRKGPLLAQQVLRDTISFSTFGYAGINSLWMEVNPYVNGSLVVTDQLEQYHFNNLLQLPFRVIRDDEHPILDVTFNGKHILNGDIIDPDSEILISLKDENPLLIMNEISDTAFFGIYLNLPDGTQVRVPFIDNQGNTIMQWYPADAQTKRFKILYPKSFQKDGKYTLIVQGADRSGNISGNFEYRAAFEIIRESSITYLMNYPNPFSTSTRFVFTLTGTEEPEDVIIQIMTVTGRVVREITEDQLGKITIGRNMTDYAWDGTDEFGDPLANGVYLYRVKAKINGEDIKHRETTADQFFKEEFGKMYLFR